MIVKLVLLVLFALCADAFVLVNNPLYCYSWDQVRHQITMFGTTTPYEEIRSQVMINPSVSKCIPSRFWLLGRHGLRFPSVADHDNLFSPTDTISVDIMKNYNSFKTTLCPSDAELIKKWKINPNFTLPTNGALTESGHTELTNLGKRMQKAFPTLLPKHYTPEHYYFRHSVVHRTLESARAFAEGLFGRNECDKVNYEGSQFPDPYLLPFYSCPVWLSHFRNVHEAKAFIHGPKYQKMVKEVSAKLGFEEYQQLNSTIVDKLITHCKYEQIYNHIAPSAFCSAFSIANHQVIEYYKDLKFYYGCGYGNSAYRKLYENLSCSLLQAMLKFLQSNDPSDQKAKFWFGHDVTLQMMFTALGLFEDKIPLTGSNFAQQTYRQWKTSFISPMAGNLAVIRFDCTDGDNDILFLHNENPLQIPGCKPNGICKQSLIMQRYSRFLNANCDALFCTNSI